MGITVTDMVRSSMSILGPLGGAIAGGLCAAFCAAVREVAPKATTNPENSVVRVAGAVYVSNADNLVKRAAGASGAYSAVLAFDVDGQYIGHSNGTDSQGNMSAGFVDVVVHQEELGPGKQTAYVQIIRDEPICLSYVLHKRADGKTAIWTGDVGRKCGKEWYYSDARIGNYLPDCTWVDSAIQLRLRPIVETTLNADLDAKKYCGENSLSLKADSPYGNAQAPSKDAALFSGEGSGPSSRKKRSQDPQPHGSPFSHLVASHHDHHSAEELCESVDSRGPDFVSFAEQKYCDMATKEHFPFCSKSLVQDCFDGKTPSIVMATRSVAKIYSTVVQWGRGMGCPPNYPSCGERCPPEWETLCECYGWGVGGPMHTYAPPPRKSTVWSPPTGLSVPTPTYYRRS